MQIYLLSATRYLLCLVSMILTGLFVFSFVQHHSDSFNIAVVLMVCMGVGIDLSKYLFWQYRSKPGYRSISLLLLFFSWAASVSYFMVQESSAIETEREQSQAYQAYLADREALKKEIAYKEALIEARSASRYHEQWDKSEALLASVHVLNSKLKNLMAASNTIGLNEAQKQVKTTAFFSQLSELLNTSLSVVTLTAYGLLALLVELCALGTISLSQQASVATKKPMPIYKHDQKADKTNKGSRQMDSRTRKLRQDIAKGITRPVFADIKRKRYGISQDNIKSILEELHQEGILAKNNGRYRLGGN